MSVSYISPELELAEACLSNILFVGGKRGVIPYPPADQIIMETDTV